MADELKEGAELSLVSFEDGGSVHTNAQIGPNPCKRITVSMQPGQMAMVPWARCEHVDGTITLWNLAKVEGVTLKNTSE